MDEALKLNLKGGTIYIERSIQISQKCRSYRLDWGGLEDQLKLTDQIAQMDNNLLNRSRNI